jgi:hypothetical protein
MSSTTTTIAAMATNNVERDTVLDRESLLRALNVITRTLDRRLLDTNDLQAMQDEQLVGMLDAAVEVLTQHLCRSGRGKGRRDLFVKGHREYLSAHEDDRALMRFYQSRLERVAAEMRSSLSDFPA